MIRFVPYLAVLACPVMMIFCMRGMMGGTGQKEKAEPKPGQATAEQRIAQLERELAEFRAAQAQQQPAASAESTAAVGEQPAGVRLAGRGGRPS